MKNTILTLLAVLSLQAQASQPQDITGVSEITNDSRLNETSCLRMISATTCGASGHLSDAIISGRGSCSVQMAFRLSSNENVIHPVTGIGNYSSDFFDGPMSLLGIAAEIVTLGLSDRAIESSAKHAAFDNAEKNLKIQIAKVAETLELKGVAKCADFKNNSATVHKPTESNSAE